MFRRLVTAATLLLPLLVGLPARGHEGHDHDKPPALNLPVAPRVVAVTPELELVGVRSGAERLTVFLHEFATNAPVKGARMTVSAGSDSMEAKAEGDGVFTLGAPWLALNDSVDLVFALTLGDGTEDLLTGRLQSVSDSGVPTVGRTAGSQLGIWRQTEVWMSALAGLIVGVLGTLLMFGSRARQQAVADVTTGGRDVKELPAVPATHAPRREKQLAGIAALVIAALAASPTTTAEAAGPDLPSLPSTMATDLAQRMPDGTLFVPKATQHLLSIRTVLTARNAVARSIELPGVVVPAPEHFGRVQPGRPGRIEAVPGGLAFIGKRVEKGEVLALVRTYIEAADRANIDSQIAETEARIEKSQTILSRYEKSPGAVPQVKVDEVRGELDALRRKRAELRPSVGAREPVLAPISGIISLANATIGQIVDARDVLYEIVDPSQFWVEANGYDQAGPALRDMTSATALVGQRQPLKLEFAGQGLMLRQQATVLNFRILAPPDGLSIGMPVKVLLQSKATVEGFVLPASAIVRGQTGLPIVWVKTEPERFEPQPVNVAPLDGSSVVITAGLKEDMRIVTDGVTLLNQVR